MEENASIGSGLSGCPWWGRNGIIHSAEMAEKRQENEVVRYSAAYFTGAERIFYHGV